MNCREVLMLCWTGAAHATPQRQALRKLKKNARAIEPSVSNQRLRSEPKAAEKFFGLDVIKSKLFPPTSV